MPTFASRDKRTISIRAPHERVAAALASPDDIARFLGDDLEASTKVDDRTLRIVRKPVEEMGVRFHGDYTVRYTRDGTDRITWTTITNGNMRSHGSATVTTQADGTTRVEYDESIECDMEVNRLLAVALRPIVERKMKSGVGAYLERVKADLERAR
ncbi:MAG TPA: SRPBCC family protein [Kofleriaceae bacterium]|nr:SRPBCC family protein [Kofleriaceae bacterium]